MDPNGIYEVRRRAAMDAARTTRAEAELGLPSNAEQHRILDERVKALVIEWTRGWEGTGLPGGRGRRLFLLRRGKD